MKLSVCQLPSGLLPSDPAWAEFVLRLELDTPDLAILNEMPFGAWVANEAAFNAQLAADAVHAHESALAALRKLPCASLSSRPVRARGKLANEAFLMADGKYRTVHHKHYFPEEPGFFEDTWFAPSRPGFEVIELQGLRIGVLLCSELMFTEWARHYRRQGAHVIACPRATGTSMRCWDAAARMAAIVSGCYVVSSNRLSDGAGPEPHFGGRGFAYSPTGELLCETSTAASVVSVDIDKAQVADAQRNYPCNVRELA